MADILHLIGIGVAPARVYTALTTTDGVRQWWTRDADLGVHVGEVGEFRFSYDAERVATRVRIAELREPTRVVWDVLSSFRPEWHGTKINFDVRPAGDDSVLAFAHRGFVASDDGYAMTTTGWAYYLVSLKQYLERGAGAPSPDIDFSRMLG